MKRKHVVFVVGSYGKYMSPGANIAEAVFISMSRDHDISVLAHREYNDAAVNPTPGIGRVILIKDFFSCLHHDCVQKIRSGGAARKLLYTVVLTAKRGMHYCSMLLRRYSYSGSLKWKTLFELEKLNSRKKIDVLIAVSEPHDAVFAGLDFKKKHPDVIFLPYQLDRFANGNSLYKYPKLQRGLLKRNLDKELELLSVCDRLLILPPILPHYQDPFFDDYRGKIAVTEHPLVRYRGIQGRQPSPGDAERRTVIVYAGSVDRELRNPEYWLRLLEKTVSIPGCSLACTMFSFGNCGSILEKYEGKLGGCLQSSGRIPYSQVVTEYGGCDFILTIGNNSDEELPSKLFDCVSFGKPIVHLYYSEKDGYIQYLSVHPAALCLPMKEELLEENARRLAAFCREYAGRVIGSDVIDSCYKACTPKYVARQFYDAMGG